MKDLYKCGICGVVSEDNQQVCDVQAVDRQEEACGHEDKHRNMCKPMKEHVSFVCNSCGRPAEQEDHLCDPLVLG